ncbi:DUF1127 domain-containing protein [Sodalis ligni]|nr:DUF1127 domain-containing protein [Sodalis ligni]
MQKSDLIRYDHGDPAGNVGNDGIKDLTDNIASDGIFDKAGSDVRLTHIAVKRPAWWTALFQAYQHWRARRRDRKGLMSLNDGQLRDIGLSRGDLPYRDERKF